MNNNQRKIFCLTPCSFAYLSSDQKWIPAEHLRYIDNFLLKLSAREINRLIINMPPRHGKSELISKYFPAWYLGNHPEHRIILTSYDTEFASLWSKKVRNLLKMRGKSYFDLILDSSSKAADTIKLQNSEGELYATGCGGSLTGRGADLIIIDDPVKNDAEANSNTIRENLWNWFNATLMTRLEPTGIAVLIMTRWHNDDICGRLEKEKLIISPEQIKDSEDYNDIWIQVKIPAIAEDSDLLGRNKGDVLWENRFPLKKLKSIKKQIGNYWFSALYQQSPVPDGNSIFKREDFRYYDIDGNSLRLSSSNNARAVLLEDCRIFATTDLAISGSETSDYTVSIVFALSKNNEIMILEVTRQRFTGANHLKLLKAINDKWKPLQIGIETTQYQLALLQSALRLGLPAVELKADKDKVSRALNIAAFVDSGRVYFKRNAEWLDEFENELLTFPKGKHDDQVDAFSYIVRFLNNSSNQNPVSSIPKTNKSNMISKNFK